MRNHQLIGFLWLDDAAEAAAQLYLRAFGGTVLATSRYPGQNPSGRPPGSVMTMDLELSGFRFTLLNGGPLFTPNPSISFFVHCDRPDQVDERCAVLLADGGAAMMPVDRYPWSERYGWVTDRFGVSWQVMYDRPSPASAARFPGTFVPCLMFSDAQRGRAEEAMRLYTRLFPHSEVVDVARYEPGEGPAGFVKHGRFLLAGQALVAMDSHVSNQVTFNEAISLQVLCEDQRSVDALWDGLVASGGQPGRCGWLKDAFGVSWQVVPMGLGAVLGGGDAAARGRAYEAMMGMSKLDLPAMQRAAAGR